MLITIFFLLSLLHYQSYSVKCYHKYMVGIIISVCLAALVSAGLIAFIYKSHSKSSDNVETNRKDGKICIGKVDSKTYEENMKKDLGPEINSAIDYLDGLVVFGTKEEMTTLFKNFKHVDAKTQDSYLECLGYAINFQKKLIDDGIGGTYSDIPKRLTNLNSLKQYLINNK